MTESISGIQKLKSHAEISPADLLPSHNLQLNSLTSKPELDPVFNPTTTPTSIVIVNMMDQMQDYMLSTATEKQENQKQTGDRIARSKAALRREQKKALDTKATAETWERRGQIASYLINGVTAMTGIGMAIAGAPVAGVSLAVGGIGGIASGLMQQFGWDSSWVAATSVISGVIGLAGSLGGALFNPLGSLQGASSIASYLPIAAGVTQVIASGIQGYSQMQVNQELALASELEALSTKTEASLHSLQEKYKSASTSFSSSAGNFGGLIKKLNKANQRYLRALTIDFV